MTGEPLRGPVETAGSRRAISTAMMAMTTSSSISVKTAGLARKPAWNFLSDGDVVREHVNSTQTEFQNIKN